MISALSTSSAFRDALRSGAALGAAYRLCLPREAMRGASGERLGLSPGSSLDFHDYREYQPGDDLRRLDWSVYARSDKEIVKLFREEVSPKLEIILDASRSMDLPDTPKAASALTLCAALATAAANARCACSLWFAAAELTPLAGAHSPPETWTLPPAPFDSPLPPAAALSGHIGLRRNSIRVFISDLMWSAPPEHSLRRLCDHAAALAVVQILGASEENPQASGSVRLEDIENGATFDLALDESACSAYRSALASHREEWNRECRRCGAAFVPLTAENLTLSPLERIGLIER